MKRTEATVGTKSKKILKKVVPHMLAVAKRIQMKVDLNSLIGSNQSNFTAANVLKIQGAGAPL